MDHDQRLHEINTLDWADLLETNSYPDSAQPRNGNFLKAISSLLTRI